MPRDRRLGARAARRQRHCRRLSGRALFHRLRSALLLRRYLSDAEPDRRKGNHGDERFSLVVKNARSESNGISHMTSTDTAWAGAAKELANLLYTKKGAIAYVTLNRPKVLNALNKTTWEELRAVFQNARD